MLTTPFIIEKIGVFRRFGRSFLILFSNLPVFFILPLLMTALFSGISYLVNNMQVAMGITEKTLMNGDYLVWSQFIGIQLLVFALSVLISSVLLIAPIYALSQMDKNKTAGISDSLQFAVHKIRDYMIFYVYLLKYVMLLPVIFIIAYLLTLLGIQFFKENVAILGVLTFLGSILGGATGIVAIIYIFGRGIKSIFGQFLLVDEDLKGKEALEKTIKLSNDRWASIFFNLLGYLLLWGLVGLGLGFIIVSFVSGGENSVNTETFGLLIKKTTESGWSVQTVGSMGFAINAAITAIVTATGTIYIFLLMRGYQLTDKQNQKSLKPDVHEAEPPHAGPAVPNPNS